MTVMNDIVIITEQKCCKGVNNNLFIIKIKDKTKLKIIKTKHRPFCLMCIDIENSLFLSVEMLIGTDFHI